MDGRAYDHHLLAELTEFHLKAEGAVRTRIEPFSQRYCAECAAVCCRSDFCRDASESFFLSEVVRSGGGTVREDYLSTRGCLLAFGKPLLCHEYFCDAILTQERKRLAEVIEMVRDLKKVYAQFHVGRSLTAVSESSITDRRLRRTLAKAAVFKQKWLDRGVNAGTCPHEVGPVVRV